MIFMFVALILIALAAVVSRRLNTSIQPPSLSRIAAVVVAFAIAAVIAAFQAFAFETDSCVDAGGVMHSSGYCELGARSDPYVAQLARPAFTYPGLILLWLAFLINVFVPSWLAYHLVVRALRGMQRRAA